jgi:hypothetical protein
VRRFRFRSTRDVSGQSLFCAEIRPVAALARVSGRIAWSAFCWWRLGYPLLRVLL